MLIMNTFSNTYLWRTAVVGILLLCICCKQKVETPSDPWTKMTEIIDNVVPPTFPNKTYNIKDYGSIADGEAYNTEAFKAAIDSCSKNGGGTVLVPKGKYLTGPIHLKDNVNLHLEKGSEILFSKNLEDYYPLVHTSYEGTELMNFSPLVYAYKQKNVAITGAGILNGQASNTNWWPWCGKETYGWQEGAPKQHVSLEKLKAGMSEKGVPDEERTVSYTHLRAPRDGLLSRMPSSA